ncbi:DUF1097 domain-containing protein [Sinomonas sp. P10A9]|uniref:DUF1097 domain-containing protein n=1 Tax=Sinomonas puerhi TaxID=3238584 RepID=A0AB39L6I3_9MICC
MRPFIGVGISIGVLAAIWTELSVQLGFVTWVGFVAWACFYAAGAGFGGFRKGLAANISGAVYGWLVGLFVGVAAFPGALAIAVGVIALAMCLQAGWRPLSFIPGAFAGTAAFFGTGLAFWPTVLALALGAALGWASAVLGERIQRLVDRSALASAGDEQATSAPAG